MEKYVTIVGGSFITPAVLKDEKLFIKLAHDVYIPFETSSKFNVVDVPYDNFAMSMYQKNKRNEMIITNLKKRVEENYSSEYLDKYFQEANAVIPELIETSKIVSIYRKYLSAVLDARSKWSLDNEAVNRNDEMSRVQKDIEKEKLFYEYLLEENKK